MVTLEGGVPVPGLMPVNGRNKHPRSAIVLGNVRSTRPGFSDDPCTLRKSRPCRDLRKFKVPSSKFKVEDGGERFEV